MSPPILLIVGLMVAVAVAGELIGASLLDQALATLGRVDRAREDLDGLVRGQLADEIGLRGYVATGERSFLVEATPGETFDARAAHLATELLRVDLPDAAARVATYRTARERWQREVERPLLDDPRRANALALQTRGKTLLRLMSECAGAMRDDLHDADGVIARRLRWRINATLAASIGTVAVFASVAMLLARSRKEAVAALIRKESLVAALQQTLRVDGAQLPRTSVAFAYTSATREALVGGDLIDTWRADANSGWFLIADASGKGIEAARLSAFTQYAIRTLTAQFSDPAQVLVRFNRLFLDTFADPSSFVVAFLGAFDAPSGSLRYASAGHGSAFIVRPRGVEQLAPTGAIIGLGRDETYAVHTIGLVAGETLVLATDGLTESRDASGEMLGDDGVIAFLRDPLAEPQTICDELAAEVLRRSRGEVADDLAILVLRILDTDAAPVTAPFSTLNA